MPFRGCQSQKVPQKAICINFRKPSFSDTKKLIFLFSLMFQISCLPASSWPYTFGPDMRNLLCDAVGSSQHPLCSDQSSPAQILVQRIDERDLPTPFGRFSILASHHSSHSFSNRSFDPADVFIVNRSTRGRRRKVSSQRGGC